MITRYAESKGKDISSDPETGMIADTYGDVSEYARSAVAWCIENGILTGREDGSLDPHGAVTRAETAAMIVREYNAA